MLKHSVKEDENMDGIDEYKPKTSLAGSNISGHTLPANEVAALEFGREAEMVLYSIAQDIVRTRNAVQSKYASGILTGSHALSFVKMQSFAVQARRDMADRAQDLSDFKEDYLQEINIFADAGRGVVEATRGILRALHKDMGDKMASLQAHVLYTSSLANKILDEGKRSVSLARKEVIDVRESKFLDDIDTPLNGNSADWSMVHELQKRVPKSRRAANFVSTMRAANMPICNDAYVFVQSPKDYHHTLSVCGYRFSDGELVALLAFLCTHPWLNRQVKKLVLYDCSITDKDCKSIATSIKYLPLMNVLSLASNLITDVGATCLATALWETGKTMQVRVLNLDHNSIGTSGAKAIAGALGVCSHLEHLSLSGNKEIGNVGLFHILHNLLNPRRKAYKSFRWYSPEEGEEDFIDDEMDVYDELAAPETGSQRGSVTATSAGASDWHNNIQLAGRVERIMSAKEEMARQEQEKALEELNWRETPLKRRMRRFRTALSCATAFLALRNRGRALTHLDMSHCSITKDAGPMVGAFMKEHRSLVSWVLDGNSLTDAFLKEISPSIVEGQLESLSLRGCDLTDSGVEELVRGVQDSRFLVSVDLSHNKLSSAGAAWLASVSTKYFIDHVRVGRAPEDDLPSANYVPPPKKPWESAAAAKLAAAAAAHAADNDASSLRSGTVDGQDQQGDASSVGSRASFGSIKELEGEVRDLSAPDAAPIDDDLLSLATNSEYPIDNHDLYHDKIDGFQMHEMEWSILGDFLASTRERGKAISLAAYRFLRERLIWERQLRTVKRDGMIDLQAHYFGNEIGRDVDEEMIDIL